MKKDIVAVKKYLKAYDKRYEEDPTVAARLDRARKNNTLTQKDLQKQFTI
jgi:hypothetical protein